MRIVCFVWVTDNEKIASAKLIVTKFETSTALPFYLSSSYSTFFFFSSVRSNSFQLAFPFGRRLRDAQCTSKGNTATKICSSWNSKRIDRKEDQRVGLKASDELSFHQQIKSEQEKIFSLNLFLNETRLMSNYVLFSRTWYDANKRKKKRKRAHGIEQSTRR